ncbi:uncharacterized protein BX663DRAFT_497028 [Cokeromyces recurvatus]|uniref:uncharacterized protein n=1 Tax=Cokeromyces recurvatus TaxID=90255 RepID=UPI00221E5A11|nr:uncharacterized protein BX663DRAFT_497028 [Cokeromyces recurvatus]KAI7906594.1 hypothetical protein BX663DRAFT_497028 [Cokeromyces recurvatus]
MKLCAILFFILVSFYFTISNGLSHSVDLITSDVERHEKNIANYLVKRKSNDNKKKKSNTKKHKSSSEDCRNVSCALKLQPCPKACPQTCGYLNSPNPCCPLLGKPTCPDL